MIHWHGLFWRSASLALIVRKLNNGFFYNNKWTCRNMKTGTLTSQLANYSNGSWSHESEPPGLGECTSASLQLERHPTWGPAGLNLHRGKHWCDIFMEALIWYSDQIIEVETMIFTAGKHIQTCFLWHIDIHILKHLCAPPSSMALEVQTGSRLRNGQRVKSLRRAWENVFHVKEK